MVNLNYNLLVISIFFFPSWLGPQLLVGVSIQLDKERQNIDNINRVNLFNYWVEKCYLIELKKCW
jgi:hypothetical protein